MSQIMEGKNQILKTHPSLFCKISYLFLYLFKIFVEYHNLFFQVPSDPREAPRELSAKEIFDECWEVSQSVPRADLIVCCYRN